MHILSTQHLPVAVIGGGSWATAIIKILSDNHLKELFWWHRDQSAVAFIKKYGHNPKYLSSVPILLPAAHISSDLDYVIAEAEIIILAVPAAFLKGALANCTPATFNGKKVVSAIKGMIPGQNQLIAEYMQTEFHLPGDDFIVLTGPCHAEEVALEKLSYLTIAATDFETGDVFAKHLNNRYIKTVISADVYGTEYSAVLKNVIAIASGICHGLGYGDNFQAVLVSNAIQEIRRFVDKAYPMERDINDSAYLGDLLVTAYSQFSRNRTFGAMLGKGYSVQSAQLEMNMIAEGYSAARAVFELNQVFGVYMPILDAVYNIMYNQAVPAHEIELLTTHLS